MNPVPEVIREVEAKFRVHPPFEVPTLTGGTTGVVTVDEPSRQTLRAIYWDTNDLRLAREGVTLRHRSGEGPGKDGWHLKLPISEGRVPDASIGARDELHAAGTEDAIPDSLRDLVSPWARTSPLVSVATLVTDRTTFVLRDGSGGPLVELTDDLVSVMSAGHVAGRFREIEVEDRGGGTDSIEAVGDVLRAAGAVGGEFVPKVVRALGPQATAPPDPPLPDAVDLDEPAHRAVRDVLRRSVRVLIGCDVAVRRDQPDAVHQLRVIARRLRSALKLFAPILDPQWSDSLRVELKWLADSLAGARDSEVLLARLTADLDELPTELVIGPARARIERNLRGQLATGGETALETLRSNRYLVLLERLVDAAWEPMTAPAAEAPAVEVLPPLVAKTWTRLERRVSRLGKPDATDNDWHQARIKAKALRYSCDAVAPAFGKPARALSKRAEAVQEVLGEHQDAIVAAEALRSMATARGAGSTAFTLGVLHTRQTDAAAAAQAEFWRVWAKTARAKHRKWLST
jgi:CHAD domain-containing protein